eukprot:scaffold187_cov266-Chaetoceros_neogracile.AAC.33
MLIGAVFVSSGFCFPPSSDVGCCCQRFLSSLSSASLPATCYELPLMIDDVFSSSFIPFILLPILFSIPSFGPIRTFGVKVQIKLIESRKVQKGVCRCVLYVGRNVYRVSVS